jgi:hypothetical protein
MTQTQKWRQPAISDLPSAQQMQSALVENIAAIKRNEQLCCKSSKRIRRIAIQRQTKLQGIMTGADEHERDHASKRARESPCERARENAQNAAACHNSRSIYTFKAKELL